MNFDQWENNFKKLLSLHKQKEVLLSKQDKEQIRQNLLIQVHKRAARTNNIFWRIKEILYSHIKSSVIIATASIVLIVWITISKDLKNLPYPLFVKEGNILPSLTKGPFLVKGTVNNKTLCIKVECKNKLTANTTKQNNNPLIHHKPHIDVAVANEDRTEVYRILIAQDGSVYNIHQAKSEKTEQWENDTTWNSKAKIYQTSKSRWTTEFAVPITKGWINISDRTPDMPEPPSDWHNIKFEH